MVTSEQTIIIINNSTVCEEDCSGWAPEGNEKYTKSEFVISKIMFLDDSYYLYFDAIHRISMPIN